MTESGKTCKILDIKQEMTNGKLARMVRCWCGQSMRMNGLGSHLYYAHKQKKGDVIVE